MHSAANIMYALTPIVTILIHTSCVCTVTAHVADFMLYKNIPRIFINHIKRFYHHFNPPILQILAAPLERALNKYPGSSSDPTIRLQDQYSFEYTKLASVPTWAP